MSRTSKTKGTRLRRLSNQAATAQKNCGEVPTTTSGRLVMNVPKNNDDEANERKLRMRLAKPLLGVT